VPQATLTFQGRLLGEHLDELGAPPPLTVSPDTPVDVAIARMTEAEADCVLVTEGDRLVGIFTDRDAVLRAAGKPLDSFHVRDVMTTDPVVLRHDDPIAVAIHKMAVGGFRHIPIVEDGRPTGVVTARDVFHHLAKTLD
jgi:CBS domain-containing protein